MSHQYYFKYHMGILGGPSRAINFLCAEDNWLQIAGSLVQNDTIFVSKF